MELIAKKFNELTLFELYEILKARAKIFIMEQNIHYLDLDDLDYSSLHCFFMEDNKVIAYLRAFYTETGGQVVKIGRVLTIIHNKGVGSQFVRQCIEAIKNKMPCKKIIMDAQKHAENFYKRLGFVTVSGKYLEEGIIHVNMEMDV